MIFPDAAFQIFPPEPSKSQGIKELLSKTLLRKNDSCSLKSLPEGIGKNICTPLNKGSFSTVKVLSFRLERDRNPVSLKKTPGQDLIECSEMKIDPQHCYNVPAFLCGIH